MAEIPIERPKKTTVLLLGQKKRHTIKTQVVADKQSRKIICVHNSIGRTHHFELYKVSKLFIRPTIRVQADTGCLGINKQHENSELPQKRSKKHPLNKEAKKQNQRISFSRIAVENIIRELEIFRIVSEKYRNRRKRFNLRINLMAAIYNLQLK